MGKNKTNDLFIMCNSVESAIVDGDGLKHILLCRVLLGKTEAVNRFSTQCHPSSEEFDSGVDDLVSPKKYIIWSSQMNTHILPEFVISFKTQRIVNSKLFQESYILVLNVIRLVVLNDSICFDVIQGLKEMEFALRNQFPLGYQFQNS